MTSPKALLGPHPALKRSPRRVTTLSTLTLVTVWGQGRDRRRKESRSCYTYSLNTSPSRLAHRRSSDREGTLATYSTTAFLGAVGRPRTIRLSSPCVPRLHRGELL